MPVGPLRFFHVNVNCSDLERSLAFYRDLVGLKPTVRTRPERPQPGGAFGLDEVQWDAWILAGDDAPHGVVLDLLEWQVPPPSGSPPATVTELGFARLCILTDDLAGLHHRLAEAGHDVWSPPARVNLGAEGMAAPELFVCSDPDGTPVQFVQADSTRLAHVNVNCSDLEQSRHFYCDVLGLNARIRSCPSEFQPGAGFRVEGNVAWDAWFIGAPGANPSGFILDLVEWKQPQPTGTARRRANELGIFRMALLTDDIDRDYEALLDAEVTCYSPPVALEMGPGLPSDLRALFFEDPDGTCVELIESPPPG